MSPNVVLMVASMIVLAVWWVTAPRLMWIDAQLTRSLLAPTENSRLAIRVRELAESRAEARVSSGQALAELRDVVHAAGYRDRPRLPTPITPASEKSSTPSSPPRAAVTSPRS